MALFGAVLLVDLFEWLPLGGGLMLTGLWLFVGNLGLTLDRVRPWDITARHCVIALGFLLLLSAMGLTIRLCVRSESLAAHWSVLSRT